MEGLQHERKRPKYNIKEHAGKTEKMQETTIFNIFFNLTVILEIKLK